MDHLDDDETPSSLETILRIVRDHPWRIGGVSLLGIAVGLVAGATIIDAGRDDSDPKGYFSGRSGLTVYTDARSGCQYLRAGSIFGGSLTPRADGHGGQIGCRPNNAREN